MPTFVVVDTETTGINPATDRIIEIGAVRVHPDGSMDRWSQLVDPGIAVPWRITRLTGIRTADVAGAPTVASALEDLGRFAEGALLVAHHAGFDRGFLLRESERTSYDGPAPWRGPVLCTLRLARRLLPGLPSRSLKSLCRFYGIRQDRRHRALDDAEATAQVLMHLVRAAEAVGARSGAELIALQGRRYAATGAVSPVLERLRRDVLPDAPTAPGVYRFLDATGGVLYVGKAANLRSRLRQYLTGVQGLPPRTRTMLTRARRIDWEVCATELEAMLLENRTIKALQPRHNRLLKDYGRRPYLVIDEGAVAIRTFPVQRSGRLFGPLESSGTAQLLASMVAALFGLRRVDRRRPRSTVDRDRMAREQDFAARFDCETTAGGSLDDFAAGNFDWARGVIRNVVAAASADLAFETAAVGRDWLELLDRMATEPDPALPAVFDRDVVLSGRIGERFEAALLWGGRVEGVFADPGALCAAMDGMGRRAEEGFDAARETAERLHVVSRWAYRHRATVTAIERRAGEDAAGFRCRVASAIEELHEPVAVA